MDETTYLSLIHLADQKLLREAHQITRGCDTEAQLGEFAAWPDQLSKLLYESTATELLCLQFATERYYARLIKLTSDHKSQDELIWLAYLRVVQLQFLRGETDMGFTDRELSLVVAVIKWQASGADEEPRILEIGCGAGTLLEGLARRGYRQLNGIDIAPAAVEKARNRLASYGLADRVRQRTAGDLLRTGHAREFDVVLLCDVIEHVPSDRARSLLGDVRQLLRPSGTLVLVTPNSFTGPHDITRHFRPSGSEPEGLHLHEYSLRELIFLLTSLGFGKFAGVRLRNCLTQSEELHLGTFSVRVRLALELALPHLPLRLKNAAVNRLYYSALCAKSPAPCLTSSPR